MCKNCIYCKSKNCVKKMGKNVSGSQRYIRKNCGKSFVLKPKKINYDEEFKKKAMKLYFEGNSSRAVARLLNIGINTCLRWIKAYSNKINPKNYKNERVEVIEMDELYSFISKKKPSFLNNFIRKNV